MSFLKGRWFMTLLLNQLQYFGWQKSLPFVTMPNCLMTRKLVPIQMLVNLPKAHFALWLKKLERLISLGTGLDETVQLKTAFTWLVLGTKRKRPAWQHMNSQETGRACLY